MKTLKNLTCAAGIIDQEQAARNFNVIIPVVKDALFSSMLIIIYYMCLIEAMGAAIFKL